jgi:tRNA-dihydrouridine synthase
MGCPDRAIAARGCGAALIQTPKVAQGIIRATQEGARDFAEGMPLERIGLSETTCQIVGQMASRMELDGASPKLLPVSVKTRLGYDRVVIEDWIGHLLEMEPAAVTIHGRTLKQGYRGSPDWDAIGRATEIAQSTPTLLLGNGNILTPEDASRRISQYGVDGVLIGRGAMGNPWFFQNNDLIRSAVETQNFASLPAWGIQQNRWEVALEHAAFFDRIRGTIPFPVMRKQLGWYARGKEGGLRSALVRVTSLAELAQLLAPVLSCVSF